MTAVHSRLISQSRRTPRSSIAKSEDRQVPDRQVPDSAPLLASLRLQIICIAATLIAASIFTLTEHEDHRHTWWCAFEIAMQALLVVVGTFFFRARLRLLHNSSVILPALVMVVTLSLLCEPIQRLFFGHGHPFEVLVMHSQSNLMLALAVCGFRPTFQRLAMISAVFLTIFSCTISNARGLLPLTILFAMACVTWLVASWWETVDRRLAQTDRHRRPLLWLAAGLAVPLLLMLAAAGFGTNTVTAALKGFLPSSGGTGGFDPFSRGGVNDGDALVAGNDNIKSFAPLEDAPFLDSDKPSLYDMLNDMFDDPPKKIKDQERAIALPPEAVQHIHQKMAEAKQAGREFSLLRNKTEVDRKRIRDLDTHAAFYVAGRVPAHFRMEVYEHFDGVTWYPLSGPDTEEARWPKIKTVDDRHWLSIPLPGRGFEIFADSATHSLKIANLDGNVIPSPPHLVGVSIDHVDREDMYHYSPTGIVSLQRKSVPEMTPINVASEYVVRDRLLQDGLLTVIPREGSVEVALADNEATQRIRSLAEKWTQGIPRGWKQISAIESRLKQHCVLDRDARPPEDSESPVGHFLFEQRRGPEYLFASSAACLLRSLGYSARMVSGFYARAANYEPRKQHTAVFARDAHFWCEVFIGVDTWITIEPSPGYEVLGPPPGVWSSFVQRCHEAWLVAVANAVPLIAVMITITTSLVYQRRITERLRTWYWRLKSSDSKNEGVLELAALIDERLRMAGQKRRNGTTLNRWAQQSSLQHVRPELLRLAALADSARFGPQSSVADEAMSEISHVELMTLERQLTVSALRNSNATNKPLLEPAIA